MAWWSTCTPVFSQFALPQVLPPSVLRSMLTFIDQSVSGLHGSTKISW